MDSLTGVGSGDVRFTPESGHNRRVREMSANDPKRTFIVLRASQTGAANAEGNYPPVRFMAIS